MMTGTLARRTTGSTVEDKRVGCNVEKDEIDVGAAELVPCGESFLRRVDQSQVHHLGSSPFELLGDLPAVSF